jgi:death-on-curing protein
MREPRWVQIEVIKAIHTRQINEHGGIHGIRDTSLLQSAMDAPKNSFHYGAESIIAMAAKYAYSLASNHPFADGNKRTAYICMRLFLKLNGYDISADGKEKIHLMTSIASGTMSVEAITAWLNDHLIDLK